MKITASNTVNHLFSPSSERLIYFNHGCRVVGGGGGGIRGRVGLFRGGGGGGGGGGN